MLTLENDITGMSPIMTNLLEIMQDAASMNKDDVRKGLRSLIGTLIEEVRNKAEELEEENEHQNALFEQLEKAFNDNVARSEKSLEILQKTNDSLETKSAHMTKGVAHANILSTKVESILALRMKECKDFKQSHSFGQIRQEKILAIVGQLEEIVATRAAGMRAYFVQRDMKKKI